MGNVNKCRASVRAGSPQALLCAVNGRPCALVICLPPGRQCGSCVLPLSGQIPKAASGKVSRVCSAKAGPCWLWKGRLSLPV